MSTPFTIREAQAADVLGVAAIYDASVRDTHATMAWELPGEQIWRERLADPDPLDAFLVATRGDEVVGIAFSSQFRPRAGFLHSRETSVYLAVGAEGAGLGTRLYTALLDLLKERGNRMAVAVIAEPNPASTALHERLGYTRVGTFPDVGEKHGQLWSLTMWTRPL